MDATSQSSNDDGEIAEEEFVFRAPRRRITNTERQERMNEAIALNRLVEARAKTISVFDPNSIQENETSLQTILYKVISKAEAPLTREQVLSGALAAGWQSNSKYHIYSTVDKELRKGYFLYDNKDGKFSLRNGFHYTKSNVVRAPRVSNNNDRPISKLYDLIKYIVNEYFPNERTITNVHFAMTSFGLKCSYSSVRRTLISMG